MPFRFCASFLAIPLVLAGCASSGNFLQEMQPAALDSAQRRGPF